MQYATFGQYLTVGRGLQRITIDGYEGAVSRMKKSIGEDPMSEQIVRYVQEMYSSSKSYSYKTNTALAIERWTEYKGHPMSFGRQKKPRQIVKDTLTEAEVTRMIFSARSKRDKAMLTMLAYSGCRNLEICNMRVSDFDPGRNTVRIIKGKGIKDGVVNVSAECTRTILDYLQSNPRGQGDFMFTTYQNNKMTTGAVRKQV